jgi:hypothetical protein
MATIHRSKTGAGPWLSTEDTGGGGSLPDWWTDNGDIDGLTMTMDPAFNDAIIFDIGDIDDLAGNAYIFRVYDSVNDAIVADFDAFGSYAIFGNSLGSNQGSLQVFNNDPNLIFKAATDGSVRIGLQSIISINDGALGFFGAQAPQQTGVAISTAAIHAALVSYGLITA